ncbi:hypothetical protein [Epilithonimonas zeae]|uniref:hypothetical protein n=1 Tax=Epilithonimonas zeae TaxID=1416779 RepID=UPI00200D1A76|nr:hypothetical protein [Epilithonimonas zeae]UQB68299.1 hypothetical protein KI430_14930 [Epilithonimonas zeae]
MKVLYKILASVLLFFSVAMTFVMGGALTIEGKNIFSPYIDTQFAPQYLPEKFELIKAEQTIKDVEKILGQPLRKNVDSTNHRTEYWYTMDGKLSVNNKDGDFAWYTSVVYFNDKGKVVEVGKGWGYD